MHAKREGQLRQKLESEHDDRADQEIELARAQTAGLRTENTSIQCEVEKERPNSEANEGATPSSSIVFALSSATIVCLRLSSAVFGAYYFLIYLLSYIWGGGGATTNIASPRGSSSSTLRSRRLLREAMRVAHREHKPQRLLHTQGAAESSTTSA